MADNTSKKSAKVTESADTRAAAEPTLLAGGNPQIPKGDGDAPVQAYIAAMPGWKRDVGLLLDALLRAAVRHRAPRGGLIAHSPGNWLACFTQAAS